MKTIKQQALDNAWGVGYYRAITEITVKETNMKPQEKWLLITLMGHMNWYQEGRAYPSIKRLAKLMRCNERTIRRLTAGLTSKGWLITKTVKRPGGGTRLEYYPPDTTPLNALKPLPPAPRKPPKHTDRDQYGQFKKKDRQVDTGAPVPDEQNNHRHVDIPTVRHVDTGARRTTTELKNTPESRELFYDPSIWCNDCEALAGSFLEEGFIRDSPERFPQGGNTKEFKGSIGSLLEYQESWRKGQNPFAPRPKKSNSIPSQHSPEPECKVECGAPIETDSQ